MNHPTLKEQKQNKCRHFNGTSRVTCKAGVTYEQVVKPNPDGNGRSLPCLKDQSEGCSCDKREFFTDAEIDAQIEEIEGSFRKTSLAREAIVKHLGGPWKKGVSGSGGEIECPVCKGKLRFSRAGCNGHIHAQCLTKDCVSWME